MDARRLARQFLLALALAFAFSSCATRPETNSHGATITESLIERSDGGISHVRIYNPSVRSRGYVALIPSLGRGVEDFTEEFDSSLTTALASRGFTVLLIQPRGIGSSSGSLDPSEVDMALLAQDLLEVFQHLGVDRVSLVGHAFGNRLSRYFAATHTERVDRLVLLAAGGDFALSSDQIGCLTRSFNLALADEVRREAIACAFFAEGNDPDVWLSGWYPELAAAQIAAAQSVDSGEFKGAGSLPFLIVQPSEDFIAPPDMAGRTLAEELGSQVEYVEVTGAGHALLPEQQARVAEIVGDYLEYGSTRRR